MVGLPVELAESTFDRSFKKVSRIGCGG